MTEYGSLEKTWQGITRSASRIKWFVPGVVDGYYGSAGRRVRGRVFFVVTGTVWIPIREGAIMEPPGSELTARTGPRSGEPYRE